MRVSRSSPHTKNGPGALSPNIRTEAAAPATTKAQGRMNSTAHSTAARRPMGGATATNPLPPTIGQILRELTGIRGRAEDLLRRADPVAAELYQLGYREGVEVGERRAGERAARAADQFLYYLAEDDGCTPRPIPPLDHPRGAAA